MTEALAVRAKKKINTVVLQHELVVPPFCELCVCTMLECVCTDNGCVLALQERLLSARRTTWDATRDRSSTPFQFPSVPCKPLPSTFCSIHFQHGQSTFSTAFEIWVTYHRALSSLQLCQLSGVETCGIQI